MNDEMPNKKLHDEQEKRIPGWHFGNMLWKVLGQPVGEYGGKDITIHIPHDDVITVTIERHVRRDEVEWLLQELEKFQLVPLEHAEPYKWWIPPGVDDE